MNLGIKRIYLDNASSTPIDKVVLLAMYKNQLNNFANPSAIHKQGVLVKKIINNARESIANILNAHSDEIIFTGNGTESDNLAIRGIINNYTKQNRLHIITTNIEHSAVLRTCQKLETDEVEVSYIQVGTNGIVDSKLIKNVLKENTKIVSIIYANNEIGTIQPIQEIAKIIRYHRKIYKTETPFFHIDATQAINYLDINVNKLGVDLMTFNGSKIYGPKGIGVLYKRRGVMLEPILFGGGQENKLRSGTENVSGIIGISEALKICERKKDMEVRRLKELQSYFISELEKKFPRIILNGDLNKRLPNIINISIPNIDSELLVIELDAKGIAVSSESACKSNDRHEGSYVVKALRPDDKNYGNIRFSMGRFTTKKQIIYTLKSLGQILKKYNVL